MIKKMIFFLISFYQKWISPFLGSNCRFHPTCSQYAQECFQKHSLFKATYLSLWRILRCQPFSKGGDDPVP